jgi:CubicO group peptidase (beta-lactamase class C family)
VAALRLVDRGLVRLDGSVCHYLARCPSAWRPVSLRHLLSHTSGVPDLFGELPAAPVDSTRAVIDAAIARHMNDSLLAAPGTAYRYSNFNYFLAGYAMEVAAGQSWETILRAEVFGPAGMADTEYDDVWAVMPGRARGYAMADGALRHIRYRDHAAYAAGGLLSTARDLLRFDSALTGGRLLGSSTFQAMSTPVLGDYGLGWQVITVFGRTLRNHSGGTNGFSSHLAHYDDGTRVVVLSNIEDWNAKATACDIAAIAFGLVPSPRSIGTNACRPAP